MGENYGQITNSNVTGSITGRGEIGGLAGINYGLITDSWASGTMTDVWSGSAGGLVGENFGTISNCHAEAAVTSESSFVGGLVGYNFSEGIITDSYWDMETSQQDYSDGGTGKNTAAMKQQATYEEWDFDTTWDITGSDNDGYPFLRWQERNRLLNRRF